MEKLTTIQSRDSYEVKLAETVRRSPGGLELGKYRSTFGRKTVCPAAEPHIGTITEQFLPMTKVNAIQK